MTVLPRIGVQLPYPQSRTTPTPAATLALAKAIEDAGFDGCAVADHPFPLVEADGATVHHTMDPFVQLAAIAAVTSRLRLITMAAVLPYRNPFLTAKAAASLDHLAGGRLILGGATGYHEPEFHALGADFARRNELTDEAIEAIKAAWTGQPVHAHVAGRQVRGNLMRPAPSAGARPPIWMCGNSDRAMRRAVRSCDGWAPYEAEAPVAAATRTSAFTAETLPERLRQVRRLLEESGRGADRFDICVLRARFDWEAPPAAIRAELASLADNGVSWVLVRLPRRLDPAAATGAVGRMSTLLAAAR
ncbi:TIGR03619 family F420-dependent LLM class oxidoreductase [Dactylosporangium sp. CA-092794]|uniref:TIGR03619 family F420-dependent LLM class oxidoreductase n=1 Tax=Dactylosporangium sp. CA-092794 TaxID=3239929 RepID=UPI003D90F2FE